MTTSVRMGGLRIYWTRAPLMPSRRIDWLRPCRFLSQFAVMLKMCGKSAQASSAQLTHSPLHVCCGIGLEQDSSTEARHVDALQKDQSRPHTGNLWSARFTDADDVVGWGLWVRPRCVFAGQRLLSSASEGRTSSVSAVMLQYFEGQSTTQVEWDVLRGAFVRDQRRHCLVSLHRDA